jgi:hypothetical protein
LQAGRCTYINLNWDKLYHMILQVIINQKENKK